MIERTQVVADAQPRSGRRTRTSSRSRSGSSTRSSRRVWTWLGVIAAVSLSIGAVAALRGPSSSAPLDPDSATPKGSMALAHLLEDRGISVNKVHTFAEASTADATQTLLIVNTSLISAAAGLDLVGTAAKRTVVVGTDGGAATLVKSRTDAEPAELTADCHLAEAQAAGTATFSDQMISGTPQRCFSGASGAGLLFKESLFVLADGSAMMNENLAEAGNAALGLNLLSPTDQVLWFIPSPSDLELAEGSATTPSDLLPSWIAPVLFQALLVFGALALWRGRRLGPLIREPLPVVVPAHETDEGYASLLQRNSHPDVAAAALREASMARLESMHDLPSQPNPSLLAGALADRLGQSEESIADVLWERRITTDTGLARLNLDLNRLEESTRLDGSTPTDGPSQPEGSTRPRNQPD